METAEHHEVSLLAEEPLAVARDQERGRLRALFFKSITPGRVGQPYSSGKLHIKDYISTMH